MAVKRLSNSLISSSGRDKMSSFIAGYSPAADEMDLIERVTVGAGGTANITFSNIPQTYQHLQIRMSYRNTSTNGGTGNRTVKLLINSDIGNNYCYHNLYGTGSATGAESGVTQPYTAFGTMTLSTDLSLSYSATILDILDYQNNLKNKTLKSISGREHNGSGLFIISSSAWLSTSAINSLSISTIGDLFSQYSTISLYGVV